MDNLSFSDSERKIDENDIRDIGIRYDLTFPEEYKSLIFTFNGGRPNRTLFKGTDDSLIFAELFPVKYGDYTVQDALAKFWIKDDSIPRYLIPIGADSADNIICHSQKADEYGSIYIWMHDSLDEIRFVANSLNEVLAGLLEFEW